MKINRTFSYPHPVLHEDSDDFLDGIFELEVRFEERPADGNLKINFSVATGNEFLLHQLEAGKLKRWLSVVCRETYYNEFHEVLDSSGQIEISGGTLHGLVTVRALLTAGDDLVIKSDCLHHEYSGTVFQVASGEIIGWSEAVAVNVGMEKLAPMESVFRLTENSTLAEGEYAVSLDQEFIAIHASHALFQSIHLMRGNKKAKPVVLNGIYVPAVLAVVEAIRNSGAAYVDRRWYRVVQGKADLMKLDLLSGDVLSQTQRLLNLPAARLTEFVKEAL